MSLMSGGFYCHHSSVLSLQIHLLPPSAICAPFFMAHFYASIKILFLHSKNLSHSPRPSSGAACSGKLAVPYPPSTVNPLLHSHGPFARFELSLALFYAHLMV